MRNRFLALALLSLPLSTAALADRQGSPDKQRACLRDVQRFCRHLMDQGDFTVLACLKENRPKISSACDTVLKTHGQ